MNGRISLPFAPERFATPATAESEESVNQQSAMETDPSECKSDSDSGSSVDPACWQKLLDELEGQEPSEPEPMEEETRAEPEEEVLPEVTGDPWEDMEPTEDELRFRSFTARAQQHFDKKAGDIYDSLKAHMLEKYAKKPEQ